ncbi:hypothetical protein GGR57DRAFT_517377 [Xylariaceae sp. FL1272]|nr:hypothetical protein GGR57DRAFT_517377 [Xylariaceae sp. FL1272]
MAHPPHTVNHSSLKPPLGAPPRPRLEAGPQTCTLFSYPSMGGVVLGCYAGVELEWLGIPRSADALDALQHCPISEDPAVEDAFALRMIKPRDSQYPYGHHYPPDIDVGYASSTTVLILKTFAEAPPWVSGMSGVAPQKPADWSRLTACKTMAERCAVLRSFGATEHCIGEEGDFCSELAESVEEAVVEGKAYAALLVKMDDSTYLDQWLMSL